MEKKEVNWELIIMFLIGTVVGCLLMFITHSEIYHHYNVCQERELLRQIEQEKDVKNWYIKEDKEGKIKIIELSQRELDSLNNAE